MSGGEPLLVAHRGARSLAPENTLASFRKAVEVGAKAVECDVQLSRDGVPVIFHDFTLERCTDFPEHAKAAGGRLSPFLSDWTLADLQSLDAGSWFAAKDPFGQIQAGAVGAAEIEAFRGERIPTFRELVALCRESGLMLVAEIKQGGRPSRELVEKTVEELRKGGVLEQCVLISFDHPSLRLAKRLQPALATGALVVERLVRPGRYVRETLGAQLISVYCPEGVFLRSPAAETYFAEDVRDAHDEGIAYHVWTVNKPEDCAALAEIGVDGIATDFPQQKRRAIRTE